MSNYLKNKRILITGAAGSVGSELTKQLSKIDARLLLLDNNETGIFNLLYDNLESGTTSESKIPVIADIRDKERMHEVFEKHQPDVVFSAAAYKHVPLMELFPDEARKTNVDGTRILVDCAIEYGVEKFIFVSTDKAVNPTSIMGKTKKEAENIVVSNGFNAVRFGNVLTSRGSVIPTWKKQIENDEPLTITDPKMERYFMTLFEACNLIIRAAEIGGTGEVYVLDMGEPIKIVDLAEQVIRLSGKNVEIKYIGARPGEKLSEKLYDTETEELTRTKYGKIWQVKKIHKNKLQ